MDESRFNKSIKGRCSMDIDLNREELTILITLLNQGRYTLMETQKVLPLANKIANSLQNYKEE